MPDFFYVYPAYLDRRVSRRRGRRVSDAEAADEVTTEQIATAARALGYAPEVEAGKQYPPQCHTYAGRVKIAKRPGLPKTRALHDLARALRAAAPEP